MEILNPTTEGRKVAEFLLESFPDYRETGNARGSTMLGTTILYNRPILIDYLLRNRHDPNPIYTFVKSAENQTEEQKIQILKCGFFLIFRKFLTFFRRINELEDFAQVLRTDFALLKKTGNLTPRVKRNCQIVSEYFQSKDIDDSFGTFETIYEKMERYKLKIQSMQEKVDVLQDEIKVSRENEEKYKKELEHIKREMGKTRWERLREQEIREMTPEQYEEEEKSLPGLFDGDYVRYAENIVGDRNVEDGKRGTFRDDYEKNKNKF